jgi:hypothetical protein
MSGSTAVDAQDEVAEYVRAARRIRARGGRDLGKVHAALRGGNAPASTQILSPPPRGAPPRGIDWAQSPILGHRGAAARQFAGRVDRRLVGGLLPWSDRRTLIREAASLGIGRFDANLIIAAVQHASAAAEHSPSPQPRARKHFIPVAPIAFLVVQLVIIVAVWRLLF